MTHIGGTPRGHCSYCKKKLRAHYTGSDKFTADERTVLYGVDLLSGKSGIALVHERCGADYEALAALRNARAYVIMDGDGNVLNSDGNIAVSKAEIEGDR